MLANPQALSPADTNSRRNSFNCNEKGIASHLSLAGEECQPVPCTFDPAVLLREVTHTHSPLVVQGEADDLLAVVLWPLPGHQHGAAGEGHGRDLLGSAGQTLPHDHRELGGGTGHAQAVLSHTLVVASILQADLVDDEAAAALHLHAPVGEDGLPILQPVDGGGWLSLCLAHKPGCAGSGAGDGLRSLGDAGSSWEERGQINAGRRRKR